MTVIERPLYGQIEIRPWVTRVNQVKNPQPRSGANRDAWGDRWSWVISRLASGGPFSGAFPFFRWTSTESQPADSRGWNIYGNPDLTAPDQDITWRQLPVKAGEPVSIQFYVRSSVAVSWNVLARIHDGKGSWLNTTAGMGANTTVPANTWVWVTRVYTPAVDGYLTMRSTAVGAGTYPSTATIDASRFQIEYGDYGDDLYIDGDAGETDSHRYSWAGVPGESVSVLEQEQTGVSGLSTYGEGIYGDGVYGGDTVTRNLLADATNLTIRRGGSRDGLGVKTDVGTMTFTLKNVMDPMNGPTFAVGQRVRCMSMGLSSTTYINHGPAVVLAMTFETTNESFTAAAGYTAARTAGDARTGSYSLRVYDAASPFATGQIAGQRTLTGLEVGRSYTVTAYNKRGVDGAGIVSAAKVGISGKSYGSSVTPGTSYAAVSYTFTATATSHTLLLEHTATSPTTSAATGLYWDDVTLTRNAYTETVAPAVGMLPIFTGRVAYVTSTYPMDKSTGESRAMVQVTVTDAVNIHVSTMRYGRDLGVDTDETFEERIAALALSSRAPIEVPEVGAPLEVYSF